MGFNISPLPTAPALENIGGLTITDGVVTGFTASKFLQASVQLNTSLPNYEICCKFSCTNQNNDNPIFRFLNVGGINVQVILGKIVLFLLYKGDSTGTRYDVNYTITSNQVYTFLFRRTGGTKYSLLVGIGNEPATNEVWSVTTSSDMAGGVEYTVTFGGGRSDLTTQYLGGSIFLAGTSMFESGELVAGQLADKEPPQIIIDDGTNRASANYLILNDKLVWANSSIYLQSDGNQYIDTNILPTSTTEMEVSMRSSTSSTTEISCGSRVAASNSAFVIYSRYQEGNYWFALGNYTGTPYSVSGTPAQKHTLKLSATNTSCSVDGDIKTTSLPSFSGNNYKIYLYKFNNGGSLASGAGSIYSVKIWQNGTLVRHFVPVPSGMTIGSYTTPSAGMFDIVNQQFYANSGTGTFTWGKD